MNIAIKVASDVWKRRSREIERQAKFATAVALTKTAKKAEFKVKRQMPRVFDRPNRWTMNAVAITPARKANPVAVVFVKDSQAKYLGIQEKGGTAQPRKAGGVLLAPVQIRKNQYGNIPRGWVRKNARKRNMFVISKSMGQRTGSQPGIYKRGRGKGGEPALQVAFVDDAKYRPRFGFRRAVIVEANRVYGTEFAKALDNALKTAR